MKLKMRRHNKWANREIKLWDMVSKRGYTWYNKGNRHKHSIWLSNRISQSLERYIKSLQSTRALKQRENGRRA